MREETTVVQHVDGPIINHSVECGHGWRELNAVGSRMRIRLIARRSPLARYQAKLVADAVCARDASVSVEFIWRNTSGDALSEGPLSELGGKGLYVAELEQALLSGEADVAVHSVKDVPSVLPAGLSLIGLVERAESRDVLVCARAGSNLDSLDAGSRVGTTSARRVFQLGAIYPQLDFVAVRGNLDTRLSKLDSGGYDALVLAAAGLLRLEQDARISQYIDISLCVPAAGQGAVGVEVRTDHEPVVSLFNQIEHLPTALCVRTERAVCAGLGADCHSALGVHARYITGDGTEAGHGAGIHLQAAIANPDTGEVVRIDEHGVGHETGALVHSACRSLLDRGAAEWLAR